MIIERLFARRDYEGLSEEGKEKLKKARKEIANKLRKKRDFISDVNPSKSVPLFELDIKDINDLDEIMTMDSKESYLKSGIRRNTYENVLRSSESSAKNAKDEIIKEELKSREKDIADKSKKAVSNSSSSPGFLKRNKKALLIGGGVAALGGAGLYGYKKYKDSKKEG